MSDETERRPRFWFQSSEGPPARARPVGSADAIRPIHPGALEAATALVSRVASADAAALFRTIVELRRDSPDNVLHETHLAAFLAGFGPEEAEAEDQIRSADRAFEDAFGTRLVLEEHLSAGSGRRCFFLADELATVVDGIALSAAVPPGEAVLDAATATWVTIVAAAVRSGRGHHLALRAEGPGDRALADFSVGLGEARVDVLAIEVSERPALALLRCELHGGPSAAAVVVDFDILAADPDERETEAFRDTADDWDAAEPALRMRTSAKALLPALVGMRNTYVWRVPPRGTLPRDLLSIVGGRIGPVTLDAAWSLSTLLEASPRLGSTGARRLLAAVGDPRDASALAALAEVAATVPGLEAPEDACRFVADSFGTLVGRLDPTRSVPAVPFDERLIACDADGLALLDRGEALSEGCRVLAVGPPSGGKTTYAAALARAIAQSSGRTIVRVEPADLLAKSWGSTERLVSALWRRASAEHHVLLADEFDSLCVRREADAPASGNAYLIRCLTNEWLRMLDAHPEVPLVATANDENACDRAILRRFTMVVPVGDRLSPAQERLAWESVLRTEPPEGWQPAGAAVGDFAAALARCRLLGRDDAASLEQAVEAARRTRLGTEGFQRVAPRRRPLH